MLTGLGAIAGAWLLGTAPEDSAPGLRALLIAFGMLAMGTSLALHLPSASWDAAGRRGSARLWLLALAGTIVARLALDPDQDSIAVLFRALTLISGVVAFLTLLPTVWRRLGISLLIVFHFIGLCTAIVIVPAPEGHPPWLAWQLWTRVYHPWLTFTALDNPQPLGRSPTVLLWFRVEFADGASRWLRLPDPGVSRNQVERRRWAGLAEAVSKTVPLAPMHEEEMIRLREEAGKAHNPPIPMGSIPPAEQYREPVVQAKLLLASYARYVARNTEHPLGRPSPVTGVKIYRVEYHSPPAQHFAEGREPLDPTLYTAFYQGLYSPQGQLTPDPFLYWLIPIVRVPKDQIGPTSPIPGAVKTDPRKLDPWTPDGRIINYVNIHAGDKDKEDLP
jgi:hypothetical protein